jgi:hypothetical protein
VVPGVTLNIGKRGMSTSVGLRGAHVTFGNGVRTTMGIPGTGLSYTSYRKPRKAHDPVVSEAHPAPHRTGWTGLVLLGVLLLLGVSLLGVAAPVVVPTGLVLAALVLINPAGWGDRIHAWRVWRALPGLHGRSTALGFAAVLLAYLVVLPLLAYGASQPQGAAAPPASSPTPTGRPR